MCVIILQETIWIYKITGDTKEVLHILRHNDFHCCHQHIAIGKCNICPWSVRNEEFIFQNFFSILSNEYQ